MNQIFLGEPVQEIKNWFVETFPFWPTYTTLEFTNGTTQTKEITGMATWKNIGVKSDQNSTNYTLKSCQLGKNVTEISGYVFSWCYSLTSVNIPDSVTTIGENAFYYCISLPSVNIPNSVSSIRDSTFYDCSSLTSVNIPNSVASVGGYAFRDCRSLSSIAIPSSVTSIGYWAFYGCFSLTSIVFEGKTMNQIKAMANYPFGSNTSVIVPGIS